MSAAGARAAVVGGGQEIPDRLDEPDAAEEVMEPVARRASSVKSPLVWATHISVALAGAAVDDPDAWAFFVASFQTNDQIATTGWWRAMSDSTRADNEYTRPRSEAVQVDGKWVLEGNFFERNEREGEIVAFGTSIRNPGEFQAGETGEFAGGRGTLTVNADGTYRAVYNEEQTGARGQRIPFIATVPAELTAQNYDTVFGAAGVGRSFVNSLTVAIPATIIPILIAAFAAYALAWMPFPGRGLLVALVVGLLVVPLQLSLIPLLSIYVNVGDLFGVSPRGYVGIWLAHTGFGLPLAIYLLRNYMVGLPREIMESARVDGASDFDIFIKIILPLSFPALASFAIFQFLWTWNDLLVALVFLGQSDDNLVLTGRLVALLGSRGGEWGILAASAFVTIVVPIVVFLALQRYLVRGLLAGSVKGG